MTEAVTAAAYTAALEYIDQGYGVIALHWVEPNGLCSCQTGSVGKPRGSCDRKTVGKHPISPEWTQGERMSKADAAAIWHPDMGEFPCANVGIRTGAISGVYGMDIDPDNGGLESLARLESKYGWKADPWQETGSGGFHCLFEVPEGIEVTNRTKGLDLGPGIDIRGDGGQIVVAPSVSGKGAYRRLAGRVLPTPEWLRSKFQAAATSRLQVTDTTCVIETLPAAADLDPVTVDRVQRYAESAIESEAQRYRGAPPGTGDFTLYTAFCSALEIAQSPWNTVTYNDVIDVFDRARRERRMRHPSQDGGQSEEDLRRCFQSARSTVVGQGRPLPPDPNAGLGFDPGPEIMAQLEAQREREREQAAFAEELNRPFATGPKTDEEVFAELEAALLDRDGLDALPPVQYLIDGLLDMNSESWMIGASGSFKSFVAQCMAAHVALGIPEWRGQKVHQAHVVYMAAEGSKAVAKRARAWELTYGKRIANFDVLPMPVQVKNAQYWRMFAELCRRRKAGFIVLDTQARITVGLKENDNGEMGYLTEAVRYLKERTGACVLVIHHTGRNGGDARGASAIDGAQDTELRVERTSKTDKADFTATLSIDKNKDGDESPSWNFEMTKVVTGQRDDGVDITSLAMLPADPFGSAKPARPAPWYDDLTENQTLIMAALRDHGDARGHTVAEIRGWLRERASAGHGRELGNTSARSALRDLVTKHLVAEIGKGWALTEHLDDDSPA